jgi:hypothetical protein
MVMVIVTVSPTFACVVGVNDFVTVGVLNAVTSIGAAADVPGSASVLMTENEGLLYFFGVLVAPLTVAVNTHVCPAVSTREASVMVDVTELYAGTGEQELVNNVRSFNPVSLKVSENPTPFNVIEFGFMIEMTRLVVPVVETSGEPNTLLTIGGAMTVTGTGLAVNGGMDEVKVKLKKWR